jgi:D-alanine-D-alanine ligase
MKKIAILTGGPGYEREISLRSAKLFETYLQSPFETFILPEQLDSFLAKKGEFDFAIPVFHGEYGEDGVISAFLQVLWIPCAFSSHEVHAFCLNKFLTNTFLADMGISVGKQILLSETELREFSPEDLIEKEKNKIETLGFPIILKPTHGGSSFYTYKIQDFSQLREKIQEIQQAKIGDSILLQEFIVGEEYSVGVIWGKALEHIMKVDKKPQEVFDYAFKYEQDIETFPELEIWLQKQLIQITEHIYETLWISGCARIDFIVREGMVYFLEINTIPWMTDVSILPKMWKMEGKNLADFVKEIIKI